MCVINKHNSRNTDVNNVQKRDNNVKTWHKLKKTFKL